MCLGVAAVAAALPVGALTAAASCRSDRDVNPSGGRTIQPVLALAADEAESAAASAAIVSDVRSIEQWWRAQDPGRVPRFASDDLDCVSTVDVRVIRLPDTETILRNDESRGARISGAILRAGSGSPFVKYLVYYFGPVDGPVCGRAGGERDGQAVAIVFASTCPDVAEDTVATHELLHALGAAPRSGPPNACPGSPDHVCDSRSDVLYPSAAHAPLDDLKLDVGRDDYYGHGGSWFDVRDSGWLVRADHQVTLTVAVVGRGAVRSDVPGVSCRSVCADDWNEGTYTTMTASPSDGARFVGWSGICSGIAASCWVGVHGSATAIARFASR